MLTPLKIQELAEPIENIYIDLSNELLVNIGKHITSPNWTHTAAWEIEKLSEMGQLSQENAEIINKWIKSIPSTLRDTMEETRKAALADIEKTMEKAAEAGYVTPAAHDSTLQVFEELAQQAAERMNLVNTTMLESSLDQYRAAVELTAEIEQQAQNTQKALNEAAASVATGVETRTKAMERAIRTIAKEGLTGFYDRAGRSWTPEAYVNMDIRTTVHNASIQSVKNRMADYNTSVFQISSHAGARPRCYPYQGGFYSWDNTYGEIELGNGHTESYEPLSNTSYGEAAGIFGINCGHFPIPIIPGYTIPHGADKDNIQPKEINDKVYQESQQQRALERDIRAKKRVVAMGDNSPEAKAAVRQAQEKMRAFIAQTGRTRRYDREQIYIKQPGSSQTGENSQKVNSQLTAPVMQPVKVNLGDKITASLGSNADEYKALVESADPNVAATYNAYGGTLNGVKEETGAGVYHPATKSIEWGYGTDKAKYSTLAHEFGHHVDAQIPTANYSTAEIDTLNKYANFTYSTRDTFKKSASSSDEFLTAMRTDRNALSGYLNSAEARKRMRDELLANRNTTTGIQDAFDGFWSTQDSTRGDFWLPWGHGNKYYNRKYNSLKNFGLDKKLKTAYTELGFDVSNQTKVKRITRDYETASELWANIQSAKTVGGDELKYMEKYFPEAVKAWGEITGRI